MIYQIHQDLNSHKAYTPHGAAAKLWSCQDQEIIISGPAETGKTLAALQKLDAICWKYPGTQAAMIRKTYKSMPGSVLQTWTNKVLGQDTPVVAYGGSRPEWFEYPNGSRVWVGGMDNPSKVLSSERDLIYVNQTEELELDEWEHLLTRVTGRAGNVPYSILMGDCNPGSRNHWILERRDSHKLTFFESRHEDNPSLFDPVTGLITEQGRRTMAILDSLTGVRYQRLRQGRWVSAEGQIYEWDPAKHLIDPFPVPSHWRRFRCVDFGLQNPFVCGWWAADEDERLYLYRQIYMSGRTVREHSLRINELSEGENIEATICDHQASDRATLQENGIWNIAATKDVLIGIGKVQDRLKVQVDGKPRLFIIRDCLVEVDQSMQLAHKPFAVEQEFDDYVWSNSKTKEAPGKLDDHGMDMVRYMVMHLDAGIIPPASIQVQGDLGATLGTVRGSGGGWMGRKNV